MHLALIGPLWAFGSGDLTREGRGERVIRGRNVRKVLFVNAITDELTAGIGGAESSPR